MSRLISHKPSYGNQYIRTSPGRDPISPKRNQLKFSYHQPLTGSTNRLLIKNTARIETDASEYNNRQSLDQYNLRQNVSHNMERVDSGENDLYDVHHDGPRLRDLCASDKKKVGELMKKLAAEKEEKQALQQQMLLKDKNYEKTISQLKKESQDYFKGSLELQEDLKSSLTLLKSVGNISSTKERQQKLFSSLISNKDQSSRSYNYRDNPLISQKENFFQNSNYSSPGGGLTSYYKDKGGVSMTTLPTQTSNKQRFLELEAELDLLERKNKAYKTMENFENSDKNNNQLLTPDYHHFKAQKRQENPLYSPSQTKHFHYKTLQSPIRPSYEEIPIDRLSSQNTRNSFGKLRNATKSFNDPSSISRETTEEKTLDLDYRPVYQKPQRDTSHDDDHHMPLKAKPMSSTENYMPSSANHFKGEEDFSLAKARTDPVNNQRKKVNEALVDIGTMNVKQLIELKNIIDERIEIEELKDKRYKFKTSPQRTIQKAEQIVRSPENQKYSMNKSMGKFSQETQKKSSQQENQRRSDGFNNYQQTQQKLRKNNSQTQSDLKENLQPQVPSKTRSSAKIEYIETDESEILRSSNKEALGKLYDKKLQEFLQVRDMMFKLQEVSSEEIEVPKVLEIKTTPQQQPPVPMKNQEHLLASPRLFTFTSPMNMTTATPMGDLPALSAKDLLPSPMGMEKVLKQQERKPAGVEKETFMRSSDRDRNSHQLTRDDSDSRFSFAEKAQNKAVEKGETKVFPTLASEPTSANLMKHTEILKYSDPLNERNTPETNAILMKIKEMLETTNNSQNDISKEELMKRYSSLSQAAMDRGSAQLSKRDFSLLQDSAQVLDTPTLFANYDLQINSRTESSVIETDLSILAINKRIDELKHDNLTSSRSRHY